MWFFCFINERIFFWKRVICYISCGISWISGYIYWYNSGYIYYFSEKDFNFLKLVYGESDIIKFEILEVRIRLLFLKLRFLGKGDVLEKNFGISISLCFLIFKV